MAVGTIENKGALDLRRDQGTRTGDELRSLRDGLDFTQDELAEKLGRSRITVINREGRLRVTEKVYQDHLEALTEMDHERRERHTKNLP